MSVRRESLHQTRLRQSPFDREGAGPEVSLSISRCAGDYRQRSGSHTTHAITPRPMRLQTLSHAHRTQSTAHRRFYRVCVTCLYGPTVTNDSFAEIRRARCRDSCDPCYFLRRRRGDLGRSTRSDRSGHCCGSTELATSGPCRHRSNGDGRDRSDPVGRRRDLSFRADCRTDFCEVSTGSGP